MFSKVFKSNPQGINQWSKNNHGIMRFRNTDHNGNTKQFSVGVNDSGKGFVGLHSVSSSGKVQGEHSLSSVVSHRTDLGGTAAKESAVHSAVTSAYASSGGSQAKVLAALKKVSGKDWASHEHVKPTKKDEGMFSSVFKANPKGINQWSAGASRAGARQQLEASRQEKLKDKLKAGTPLEDGESKAAGFKSAAHATQHLSKKEDLSSVFGTAAQHGLVQKGAPKGNKNAAKNHASAAQAASAATDKAKASGSKEDHLAAFEAHRKASAAANQAGDPKNASLHSKAAQSHFAASKTTKKSEADTRGWSGDLGLGAFKK